MTMAQTYGEGYRQATKHAQIEKQIALRIQREEYTKVINELKAALREIYIADKGEGECSKIAKAALGRS